VSATATTTAERPRFELRLPASPATVPHVRRALMSFASAHGVPEVSDIGLAVTEAVTNAILHAYRGGESGEMRVVACAEPGRLVVVVRDYGCGMSPRPDSPGLGMGLSIIGRLTDELNIECPADGGTRLRMHFEAPLSDAT
jgi:serine/threonine-protein kinase RsbW/stage II sporulation protein AB (anti-sigma F factor)